MYFKNLLTRDEIKKMNIKQLRAHRKEMLERKNTLLEYIMGVTAEFGQVEQEMRDRLLEMEIEILELQEDAKDEEKWKDPLWEANNNLH